MFVCKLVLALKKNIVFIKTWFLVASKTSVDLIFLGGGLVDLGLYKGVCSDFSSWGL